MCSVCWVWLGWSSALSRAGCMILWFRFVTKTHQCFSCCQTVLAQHQGHLFLTLPPQQVVRDGQDAGRAQAPTERGIFHAIRTSGSTVKLRSRGSSETGQAPVCWWEVVTAFASLALFLPLSPCLSTSPLKSTSVTWKSIRKLIQIF